MKILCTICMRSESKGVKNKAYRKINGFPLFYYTLSVAQKSKIFDEIVISTDSEKIARMCKKYNANIFFLRSKKLAKDNTPKIDVIKDALLKAEKYYNTNFDCIFDLDITSPLRKISDLENAFEIFKKNKSDNLFSITSSKKNPYFNLIEKKNNKVFLVKKSKSYFSRQKAPKVFDMNASIYIWRRNILINNNSLFLKNTHTYEMPEERSIDIDTEFDLKVVKLLIENLNAKK